MAHSSTLARQKKKLLGKWQSDGRKTIAELSQRRDHTPKQLKSFRGLFGKLKVWYRPSTIVVEFKEMIYRRKYKVLAADLDSIALLSDESPVLNIGRTISHIHFEGDFYWIALGNGAREFFKRTN